jgi:hypothetical protein
VIKGGASTGNGDGGNIILAPGVSRKNGLQGRIILGNDVQSGLQASFDMVLSRPILLSGDGGETFLRGQSSQNGDAGSLTVRAGQVPTNAVESVAGTLYLSPGISETRDFGKIFLGSPKASDLDITRYTIPSFGGATAIRGQNSTQGNGGDLVIRAGNSGGNGNGGSLHFVPGDTPVTPAGQIIWGLETDYVNVGREPINGGGLPTTIVGQDSVAGDGGDFILRAGNGNIGGGDAILSAGDGIFGAGGDTTILGGNGPLQGGDVVFFCW